MRPAIPRPPFKLLLPVFAAVALLLPACANPRSGAGFRLPAGDPEHGRQAFVDMKCNTCHRVANMDLGTPTIDPPVPVMLGGEVPHVKTDGELLTSIVNPSHRLAPSVREELVKVGGLSRMPDYGDALTVRQAINLVSFLQTRYTVVRPGGK